MSCDLEKLERHVAGELDETSTRALVAHAMGCAECRAELAALQRERALFSARAEGDRLDPTSWDRLAPRLRPPAPARSRSALLVGGVVAVAASLMFMLRHPVAPLSSIGAKMTTPSPGTVRPEPGAPAVTSWTYRVGEHAALRVELVSGSVNVRSGAKDAIAVSLRDPASVDPGWQIDVHQKGEQVIVLVECPGRHCDEGPDFDITLPSHAEISVKSVSADVTVDSGSGAVEVATVSGDVNVRGERALRLHSTSGDFDVEAPRLLASTLKTVSGDIRARGSCGRDCALTVQTVSGDVMLVPEAQSAFVLHYRSTSGEPGDPSAALRKLPLRAWKSSAHGLEVSCGTQEGRIDIKTVSGDLSFEEAKD